MNSPLERFSDIRTHPHLSRSGWQTTKVTKLAAFCRQRFNLFQEKIKLGKVEKLRRNVVLNIFQCYAINLWRCSGVQSIVLVAKQV